RFFFFASRRRHTRSKRDWSSDVCSSDLEREHDCNLKMREWIIANEFATAEELDALEKKIKKEVREGKNAAWKAYTEEIKEEQKEVLSVLADFAGKNKKIKEVFDALAADRQPIRKVSLVAARKALRYATQANLEGRVALSKWIEYYIKQTQPKFSSHLYSESGTACDIEEVLPTYDEKPKVVDARIVIRDNFDAIFAKHPEVLVFGEDAGKIGDVNQGLEGLQEKYG